MGARSVVLACARTTPSLQALALSGVGFLTAQCPQTDQNRIRARLASHALYEESIHGTAKKVN